MAYLTVRGLRMHYHVQGAGPLVVLLHALGSCADDWALQFPALTGAGLSRSYTVLAPDLRGHGRTGKPAGPYTIPQMADDVAALMARLETGRACVVGLSLGGLVAQALAIGHPGRVRSLVLVNTFGRLRLRWLLGSPYLLRRGLALLTGGLAAQAEIVAREVFPRPEQEPLRRMALERLRANDPAAYRATLRAVLRFRRPALAQIRVPTLVVAGARDTTVDLATKEELAAGIPAARLVVVPGSGHATPVDQAEPFNELLLEFLQEAGA